MERMPLNWMAGVPVVTRVWAALAIATSILVDTKLVKDTTVVWLPLAYKKQQYWRFITSFCYFGPLDVYLLVTVYNMCQHSIQLEQSFDKTINYLWFLLINCALLILYSLYVKHQYILGPHLVESLTYIWGRRNPNVQIGYLGLIEFRAGYYAIFTFLYSLVKKQSFLSAIDDIPGVFIGHLIFYFSDVFQKVHGIDPFSPPWEWKIFHRRRAVHQA